MSNEKYEYDKKLLNRLYYGQLIEKYNIDSTSENRAFFFAITSMDKHINTIYDSNNVERDILLGDYYSFEYYYLLKNNLSFLTKLTSVMANIYSYIQKEKLDFDELIYIVFKPLSLFLELNNKSIENKDILIFLESYYSTYTNKLDFSSLRDNRDKIIKVVKEKYVK